MAKLAGYRKSLLASVVAISLTGAVCAQAQMVANYDNNVMVDLSVLNDNGVRARSPSTQGHQTSGMKMPPKVMPKSTFFGLPDHLKTQAPSAAAPQIVVPGQEPKSRIVLRRPSQVVSPAPKLPTEQQQAITLKKPATPKPSTPKTVVKEVAKSAPKPIVKAEAPVTPKVETAKVVEAPKVVAKVEAPPAPKPAPVAPVEVKKAEPVKIEKPAPVVEKTVEAPAEKPTPAPATVMAEAPPPPPPSVVEPQKVESAMQAAKEEAVKTASLPTQGEESNVRVIFDAGQRQMPTNAQVGLKKLAEQLNAHPDDRVQLLAYAGGEDISASKARRLSLSRALAVRSYLINEGGVRSTRIDVRALGNKTTEEPFDRVDVKIAPR